MKYLKIFALALGAMMVTACSDDDNNFNTASGVSVEMQSSEMTVKENAGLIDVPLKVTGEANGPIKVTVKVEGCGEVPALPFEEKNGEWSGNYVLTSETVNIPAGENEVSVEINLLDDKIETGDRSFNVTITNVEGASIGANTTTLVTVKDDESLPVYDLIQGKYTMSFLDWDGAKANANVTITGYKEGTQEYNDGILVLEGLLNNPTALTLYFTEDKENKKYYVDMKLPEPIIWYDQSNYIWVIAYNNATGKWSLGDATVRGEFDKQTQTITFPKEAKIGYYIASPDMSSALGFYDSATEMVFSK